MGVSRSDFLFHILNNIHNAPNKIVKIFQEYKKESQDELWDSEKQMIEHYQKDENYQKLVKGDAGGNLIYKYKSMNLATAMPEWIEYLSGLLEGLVAKKNKENLDFSPEAIEAKKREISMLKEYNKNLTWKFLDDNPSDNDVIMESDYDFLAWLKDPEPKSLSMYRVKSPIRYFFVYTETQLKERYDQFRRYGTNISGLSKIVTRVSINNWFRSVGTDPNLIKDNMDAKRSRTRYAISN